MVSQNEVAIAMHAICREWGIHPKDLTEDHARFQELVREVQSRLNAQMEPKEQTEALL